MADMLEDRVCECCGHSSGAAGQEPSSPVEGDPPPIAALFENPIIHLVKPVPCRLHGGLLVVLRVGFDGDGRVREVSLDHGHVWPGGVTATLDDLCRLLTGFMRRFALSPAMLGELLHQNGGRYVGRGREICAILSKLDGEPWRPAAVDGGGS